MGTDAGEGCGWVGDVNPLYDGVQRCVDKILPLSFHPHEHPGSVDAMSDEGDAPSPDATLGVFLIGIALASVYGFFPILPRIP